MNGKPENSANMVSLSEIDTVLLQTARADVYSPDGSKHRNLRILFDSGSQQSYISPKARKVLQLKTVKERTVSIKSFGNKKTENTLDEVKFAVKSLNGNDFININALVSEICHPIENQAIEVAVKNYPHLRDLNLADSNPGNLSMDIDILIGCQDYW